MTAEGERRRVCALCRSRAEATGWMPAHLADEPLPPVAAPVLAPRAEPTADPQGPAEAEPDPPPVIRHERLTLSERALEAFNASEERRKIAGLRRSLGEPTVAVEEAQGTATVTVAWELSWYRWEVAPEGGVTEVAKGTEIEEIDPQPGWNARAGEDGRVSLTGS